MEKPQSKKPSAGRDQGVPDIAGLFAAVEREFLEERPAAYVPSSAEPGTPDADPVAPYVRAAAVLATFDASTLNPLADPAESLGADAPPASSDLQVPAAQSQ